MEFKGQVHKVGDHIDTDAIIPARFLVTADTKELGKNCFEGLEAGWVSRVKDGDIVVAGENFGCGSSREHAPLAILGAGMSVVLAKSFARIFYRNAFNMGLVLLELGDDIDRIQDGDQLDIDLEKGIVKNISQDWEVSVPAVPQFMRELLDNGGLIGYVRSRLQEEK